MYVLGIWDDHDSGVALVRDGEIRFVVNEERLTRRKLEVRFPDLSIESALRHEGIGPKDIGLVALSTSDVAKTLQRLFPGLKEEYYLLRRRKKTPGALNRWKKSAKYLVTEWGSLSLTRATSARAVRRRLDPHGLGGQPLKIVDHHLCHAAGAAFTCGFDSAAVVTLDGLGDGLSGTVSVLRGGALERVAAIPASASFGIFFEHVTNLLNMRELEDEGKVMALANYSYPIPDEENPLIGYFSVEGLAVHARFTSMRMYRDLAKVLWKHPSEQFAFMAQRALETWVVKLVRNIVSATGERKVALAGGVASNIKANRLVKNLDEVEDCYVFPHMGDGGLALGAALWASHEAGGVAAYSLTSTQLGPDFVPGEAERLLGAEGIAYEKPVDLVERTADLLHRGGIVLWCQGRTEMGPRALGGRSVLARPDSLALKERLNLKLKKRVWYQPFCPSILAGDAREVFEDLKGTPNRFMSMGYMVRSEHRGRLAGTINIDGSCRPQIVEESEWPYARLLAAMKRRTGIGALLNTSFNLHGEPMVNTPADALKTFRAMDPDALVIGDLWVEGTGKDRGPT